MAIPNFFQQQQQSLQTGLSLGNAMMEAQQNALLNPMKADLLGAQIEGQQAQTGLTESRIGQQQQKTQQEKKENFIKELKQDLGILFTYNDDPEVYQKALTQIAPKYINDPIIGPFIKKLGTEKDATKRNSALLGMIGALNPNQQQGRSTSAIKNQQYYNELKKEDPEAAEQFASSAGLTTGEGGGKKRMFKVIENDDGSLLKIFADGTEEETSPNVKIKTDDMKKATSIKQAYNVLDKAKEHSLKNGGFAINMQNGLNTMKKLDAQGFKPKKIAMVQTYLAHGSLGNYIMSSDEQLYAGAIESMINSIARRESGAAIGEEETQRFFRRYMPQAGDSEPRIKQKRNSLETQFKSIRGQSGRVYDALRITMGLDSDKPGQKEVVTGKKEEAPQSAIDYLKSNPAVAEQFKFKYGYLPEGF